MIFSKWKDEENNKHDFWSQNHYFLKLAKAFPNPIVVLNGLGYLKFLNKKAEELLGWSKKELLNQLCLFIPTLHEQYSCCFLKNIKAVSSIEGEKITVLTKSGKKLIVTYSALFIPNTSPNMEMVFLIFSEIEDNHNPNTVYRDTVKELRDLKFALDQSTIVAITDPQGVFTYVNRKFCDITKYSREELVGKTHRLVNSGYHSKEFFENLWKTISKGNVWKGEVKNHDKFGNEYWADTTIVPFLNDFGKPYQYVSIRIDITERKKAIEEINYLVYNDELTGLPNKRKFIEELRQYLQTSPNESVAVLCLDLDRFKILNDSMGHRFGDVFLKKVSERLKGCLDENDFVARQGGDEFIVYLCEANDQKIKRVTQKLIKEINAPYYIDDQHYFITCSIGVSVSHLDGDVAEELVKKADIAMYRVKKRGKNSYQFFDPNMDQLVRREMELEKHLRKALENQEFQLYYQPKLDLHTGIISGMEALLRWESPSMGVIPPNEFIPLAEETGLIISIGEWVLKQACKQNKQWQMAGFPSMRISVNLSVRQFQDPNLVLLIIRALEDVDLAPNYLELEITENITMENKQYVYQKLETLRDLGVHISIDDFGTGYSSLSYLGKFPVHTLKIDKAFVDEITRSKDTSVVRAIIALAHSFELNVIAEGVEVQEQMDCLKQFSCDEIQGYLLSKPLPAKEFEEIILQKMKD